MTVGDLIKNKDYDYISWRVTLTEKAGGGDMFFGCTASKNGELISLDGDTYSKEEVVLSYEEWLKPEEGIENGLTVVVEGEWI